MSECSVSLSDNPDAVPTAPKRKASTAGIDSNGNGRSVKRRASKACQCCRARKVRCNVTEHGAPCTNCRLDEVDCIVSESRRKKKWPKDDENHSHAAGNGPTPPVARKIASRAQPDGSGARKPSLPQDAEQEQRQDGHVPHSIYQAHGQKLSNYAELNRRLSMSSQQSGVLPILGYSPMSNFARLAPKQSNAANTSVLPPFIKPLPPKIGPDEVCYLEKKGALSLPIQPLRSELLRSYIEFVHPYMPLLDLHDFVAIIDRADGSRGRTSLILFQAVMFAGSAFVDMHHLRLAGYGSRKEARKDFFQKTRLLYDFDYDSDRVSLVQALLLLTYYYETPDDQKDTWHWMGVATSLAHTIGLHRNPDKAQLDPKRAKLWKRIWWSTYMRDRLIALGMRRPTRIKPEDYDVPMLTLDDFEIAAIPDSVTCVPVDCAVARDVDKQRHLAIMCIEKAKLCLCISHVLAKQYCVLNNNHGVTNDRTTMMLLPKKMDPDTCEVKWCDEQLRNWHDRLPEEARYTEASSGNAALDLHLALLHMIFFTTLSALHRPQVLPAGQTAQNAGGPPAGAQLLDLSRHNVRRAASAITSIATKLDSLNLVRFLPTTGVTVLLPAIIIHLLDVKAPDDATRRSSLRGFYQCMQVMGKLRDLYAAADYSTAFLEAAIRKAGIQIAPIAGTGGMGGNGVKAQNVASVEDLVNAGRRMDGLDAITTTVTPVANMTMPAPRLSMPNPLAAGALTPPPDPAVTNPLQFMEKEPMKDRRATDDEVARRLGTYLASTPPESEHQDPIDSSASDASHFDGNDIFDDGTGMAIANANLDDPSADFLFPSTSNNFGLESFADTKDQMSGIFATGLPFGNPSTDGAFGEGDFESLLNMDVISDTAAFSLDSVVPGDLGDVAGATPASSSSAADGGFGSLSGETSGLTVGMDMDWMSNLNTDGVLAGI